MSLGVIFYVIALLFFFFAGIGMGPGNLVTWGLFALTLGLLLGGVSIPRPAS